MAALQGNHMARLGYPLTTLLLSALFLTIPAIPGECETCEVPSATYPTIEAAMQVINCTEIVLAPDQFFGDLTIDRTLVLRGTSSEETKIVGKIVVQGETTAVELVGLGVAVSPAYFPNQGLVVEGDADVVAEDVVVSATDLIFQDGFELGNDFNW